MSADKPPPQTVTPDPVGVGAATQEDEVVDLPIHDEPHLSTRVTEWTRDYITESTKPSERVSFDLTMGLTEQGEPVLTIFLFAAGAVLNTVVNVVVMLPHPSTLTEETTRDAMRQAVERLREERSKRLTVEDVEAHQRIAQGVQQRGG